MIEDYESSKDGEISIKQGTVALLLDLDEGEEGIEGFTKISHCKTGETGFVPSEWLDLMRTLVGYYTKPL